MVEITYINALLELLESHFTTDVQLVCSNGLLMCHAAVLAAAGGPFWKSFLCDYNCGGDVHDAVVILPEWTVEEIRSVLQLVYTGFLDCHQVQSVKASVDNLFPNINYQIETQLKYHSEEVGTSPMTEEKDDPDTRDLDEIGDYHFLQSFPEQPPSDELKKLQRVENVLPVKLDDGRYSCHVCLKTFAYPKDVKNHMLIHENRHPLVCKLCKRGCRTLSNIYKHLRICHGLKDNLQEHVLGLEDKGDQENKIIDKRLLDPSYVKKLGSVGTNKNGVPLYKCEICKATISANTLRNHLKLHDVRKLVCPFRNCEEKYFTPSALNNHVSRVHPQLKNKQCKQQGQEPAGLEQEERKGEEILFANQGSDPVTPQLNDAARSYDKVDQEFNCNQELSLEEAPKMKEHKAFSKVACQLCSKVFIERRKLSMHIVSCHDEDPRTELLCDLCAIVMDSTDSLNAHKNSHLHSGSKQLHQCSYCPRKFFLENILQTHEKMHSSPYTCEVCSKRFPSSELLTAHTRVAHLQHGGKYSAECVPSELNDNIDESSAIRLISSRNISTRQMDLALSEIPNSQQKVQQPFISQQSNVCASPLISTNLSDISYTVASSLSPPSANETPQYVTIDALQPILASSCHKALTDQHKANALQHAVLGQNPNPAAQADIQPNPVLAAPEHLPLTSLTQEHNFLPIQHVEVRENQSLILSADVTVQKHPNLTTSQPISTAAQHKNRMSVGKSDANSHSFKSGISPAPKLICQHCSAELPSMFLLKRHLRKHKCQGISSVMQDTKLFNCEICLGDEVTAANLLTFCKRSQARRVHDCPQCDFKFVKLQELRIHEVVHTGDKPYKCHLCQKKFSQMASLKTHLKKHRSDTTGIENLRCAQCGKVCKSRSGYKSHLRGHEADEKEKTNMYSMALSNSGGTMETLTLQDALTLPTHHIQQVLHAGQELLTQEVISLTTANNSLQPQFATNKAATTSMPATVNNILSAGFHQSNCQQLSANRLVSASAVTTPISSIVTAGGQQQLFGNRTISAVQVIAGNTRPADQLQLQQHSNQQLAASRTASCSAVLSSINSAVTSGFNQQQLANRTVAIHAISQQHNQPMVTARAVTLTGGAPTAGGMLTAGFHQQMQQTHAQNHLNICHAFAIDPQSPQLEATFTDGRQQPQLDAPFTGDSRLTEAELSREFEESLFRLDSGSRNHEASLGVGLGVDRGHGPSGAAMLGLSVDPSQYQVTTINIEALDPDLDHYGDRDEQLMTPSEHHVVGGYCRGSGQLLTSAAGQDDPSAVVAGLGSFVRPGDNRLMTPVEDPEAVESELDRYGSRGRQQLISQGGESVIGAALGGYVRTDDQLIAQADDPSNILAFTINKDGVIEDRHDLTACSLSREADRLLSFPLPREDDQLNYKIEIMNELSNNI